MAKPFLERAFDPSHPHRHRLLKLILRAKRENKLEFLKFSVILRSERVIFFRAGPNMPFSAHAPTVAHIGAVTAHIAAITAHTGTATAHIAATVYTAAITAHIRTAAVHTAAVTALACTL